MKKACLSEPSTTHPASGGHHTHEERRGEERRGTWQEEGKGREGKWGEKAATVSLPDTP